jgi:hypothetical protein
MGAAELSHPTIIEGVLPLTISTPEIFEINDSITFPLMI